MMLRFAVLEIPCNKVISADLAWSVLSSSYMRFQPTCGGFGRKDGTALYAFSEIGIERSWRKVSIYLIRCVPRTQI